MAAPTIFLSGHGVILDGHSTTPKLARGQAKTWLGTKGVSGWAQALVDDYALPTRAWYVNGVGFVGKNTPGARAVTVVPFPSNNMMGS